MRRAARHSLAALAVAATCVAAAAFAQNVTLEASLTPSEAFIGESLTYKLHVTSVGPDAPEVYPAPPDFSPFMELGTRMERGSFTQIVNGRYDQKYVTTYVYDLQSPDKSGDYALPPAVAEVNGQQIKSNPVQARINPYPSRGKRPALFEGAPMARTNPSRRTVDRAVREKIYVVPEIDRTECHVREQVTVTWTLYASQTLVDRSFDFLRKHRYLWLTPDVARQPLDDFFSRTTRERSRRNEIAEAMTSLYPTDGEIFYAIPLRTLLLFPKKQGTLAIPPFQADFELSDGSSNGPFPSMLSPSYMLTIPSSRPTIEVRPLPTAGKPANFSGAVGTAVVEAVSRKKGAMQADDKIPVEVSVELTGYVEALPGPPKLASEADFSVFAVEEGEKREALRDGKLVGYRNWTFQLRASNHGDLEIPPFELSFFDPATKEYKVARSRPLPIKVEENKALTGVLAMSIDAGAPSFPSASSAPRGELERDFAYIADAPWSSLAPAPTTTSWTARPWAPWTLAGGGLFFAASFLARPARKGDARGARRKRAPRAAAKAIDALAGRQDISDGDFGDALAAALKGYLADATEGTPEGISPARARDLLLASTEDDLLAGRWFDLLEASGSLRYASGEADRAQLAALARQLIEQAEEALPS